MVQVVVDMPCRVQSCRVVVHAVYRCSVPIAKMMKWARDDARCAGGRGTAQTLGHKWCTIRLLTNDPPKRYMRNESVEEASLLSWFNGRQQRTAPTRVPEAQTYAAYYNSATTHPINE